MSEYTTHPNELSTSTDAVTSSVGGAGSSPIAGLLPLMAVGAAVAISLGVYGRLHQPTGQGITAFGFPAVLPMKAWFATGAAVLGLGQALSAAWMWGRLPGAGSAPAWLGHAHRWLGTAAFLLTLPVAYYCLWALGFQQTTTRVLVHSLLGCAFYGIFVTKMLALRSSRLGSLGLPLLGGALVATLTAIWFTSSLWFFTNVGFPGV
ncbi:MAG: DUF6529 family protein [Acidimicrobiales bacterium]